MKTTATHLVSLLLLGMLLPVCRAQDKPKPEEKQKTEVQSTLAKVSIVFVEYDGDKKVRSLPYTLYADAPDSQDLGSSGWSTLRIGSRVPVYTGKDQFQYFDVGTNIDARAAHTREGRFLLHVTLERSWVEGDVLVPVQKSPEQATPDPHAGSFREPVVRQFKSALDLKIREGQTLETTMATDPMSGKVMKVEVGMSVVK